MMKTLNNYRLTHSASELSGFTNNEREISIPHDVVECDTYKNVHFVTCEEKACYRVVSVG